jgi:hypothetical protein
MKESNLETNKGRNNERDEKINRETKEGGNKERSGGCACVHFMIPMTFIKCYLQGSEAQILNHLKIGSFFDNTYRLKKTAQEDL